MVELGRFNKLTVIRQVEFGVYLEGGKLGGILLPQREVPDDCQLGDTLSVFVYLDSDDMPVATTKRPRVQVGEFASLQVAETNNVGAFLDWGLPKQLFLPFAEQPRPVEKGQHCIVRAYIDNSGRIAASAKVEKYLNKTSPEFVVGQEVSLLIWRRTELGLLVIIENQAQGILHTQDISRDLRPGLKVGGFIKQLREDGKVDVMLDKPGYGKVDPIAKQLLNYLELKKGFCALSDKSSPDEIKSVFGVSKKAFKMAIGNLLKQGLIRQDETGLHLVNTSVE